MHRFFVEPTLLAGTPETIILPDKLAHQIRDVLHLSSGEQLVLLDNSGDEVVATVVRSSRTGVEVQYEERHPGKRESSVRIILCQGLLKSARFEWILEKGTELGVAAFVPTLCRRSMSGLEEAGPAKIARWQRIIQEAAEQCDRSRLPELQPILSLPHILNDIPKDTFALMPWEEEHALSLRDALNAYQHSSSTSPMTIMLFIGPEGGLTAEEVTLAQQHGVQSVTLGPRILRAETAALAAVANVMYALEHS
ncbi:MAG: 16S rRNA (uracil(1498)-N(3))-methyltransferase [Ktedonobacteraceae bacterium]